MLLYESFCREAVSAESDADGGSAKQPLVACARPVAIEEWRVLAHPFKLTSSYIVS